MVMLLRPVDGPCTVVHESHPTHRGDTMAERPNPFTTPEYLRNVAKAKALIASFMVSEEDNR